MTPQALKHLEDPLAYLRISPILSYAAGEVVYGPGDPADKIYLIISGRVKVGFLAEGGREAVTHLFSADDLFGESAFIETHRSTRASTLEETRVMAWDLGQIEAAAAASPKLFYALLQITAKRVSNLEHRFHELTTSDVGHRLIRTLFELSAGQKVDPASELVRIPPLTHEVLGSYIGTSREVVTLLMNRLRRAGLIDYSRKDLFVYRSRVEAQLSESEGIPRHSGAGGASPSELAQHGESSH